MKIDPYYDNGKHKSTFKYRIVYVVISILIIGSVIICKETVKSVGRVSKWHKFAIAIKTGKDIVESRAPILFKTFLARVENKILISDSPHEPISQVPVVDVYSHLYDGLKDKDGSDLVLNPIEKISAHSQSSSNNNNKDLDIVQLEPDQSSQGWKSDAHKNLPGFKELWKRYPNREWFLMIDDDTYVFMENLNDFVSDYNSSEPFYFGAGNTFVGCDGVENYSKSTMFAHGGSGILISRGAMQRLEPIWDECIARYHDCWAGDVRLGLCLRRVSVLLTNVKLFHTNPPNDNTIFSHPCSKPVTFHHLLVSQIARLYDLEKKSRKFYLSKDITMENLLSLWVSPDPKRDTVRLGDEYETISAKNAKLCNSFCRMDPKCVAYTFNHSTNQCKKQNKINILEKRIGCTSGIAPSNFICKSPEHSLEAKKLMVGL